MMSVSTIEQLKAMKFSAMAKAFQEQMNDPKTFSALGFEERFGLMVDAEWNKRQDNKRLRYVRDLNEVGDHSARSPETDMTFITLFVFQRFLINHTEQAENNHR